MSSLAPIDRKNLNNCVSYNIVLTNKTIYVRNSVCFSDLFCFEDFDNLKHIIIYLKDINKDEDVDYYLNLICTLGCKCIYNKRYNFVKFKPANTFAIKLYATLIRYLYEHHSVPSKRIGLAIIELSKKYDIDEVTAITLAHIGRGENMSNHCIFYRKLFFISKDLVIEEVLKPFDSTYTNLQGVVEKLSIRRLEEEDYDLEISKLKLKK